jgi:hypothetical protein
MASPPWCARRCAPIRSPGVVYVFRAKRADRVKLLYWDGLEAADLPLRLKRKLKSRHNPIPSPDPPRTLSDQANAGQVPPEHRLRCDRVRHADALSWVPEKDGIGQGQIPVCWSLCWFFGKRNSETACATIGYILCVTPLLAPRGLAPSGDARGCAAGLRRGRSRPSCSATFSSTAWLTISASASLSAMLNRLATAAARCVARTIRPCRAARLICR